MRTSHREVERKFRVSPGFAMPGLAAVAGVAHVDPRAPFTMENTYFDTPDLRLFRWGITLRRREGGPDAGWHLKLPVHSAGEGVRDEIRAPLGPSVPGELRDLVTPFARGEDLGPVAALRTTRTPTLLLDVSGAPVAEVVDDHVEIVGGGAFREIEVEAIPAPDGSLDTAPLAHVAHALIDAGAIPGTMSKAGAALGPRAAVPPEIPEPAWPGAQAPSGDVVQAYLARHVRRLLLADLALRRDLPDAVHQMRVSARRLRSGLKAFRPLVDDTWARALRDELGWMASGLGEARDTEVLRERLDEHAEHLDADDATRARAVIDPALQRRMDAAGAVARDVIDSPRYVVLLEDLVAGVRRPPLTAASREPADVALPPLVARAFHRLAKRVHHLDLATPSPVWHEARIAAKQARYSVDAVAPVLGHDFERLAEHLAQVTEVLGRHQDAHVAQATLRELAASADAPGAFALGRLLAIEEDAEMADRVAFLDVWPGVRRAAHRAGVASPGSAG